MRVLLVQDDASLARSIVEGLFCTTHSSDGDAAQAALRAGGFNLVVLDW